MDAVIRWHKESPKESLQHPRQLRWIFPLESVRLEQVKASEIKESHSTLILPRLWFFKNLFIYLFFVPLCLTNPLLLADVFEYHLLLLFFLWGYYLMEADEREDARRARVMWPAPRHRHAGESCPTFGAKEQLKQSSSSTLPRALVTLLFLCPLLPLLSPPLTSKNEKS